ncbi:MAG: UbiH/UbiF/VisC/COQ6 family ubiquinone biosynthesis hydroxylase [Pseudomonadota bacterium]
MTEPNDTDALCVDVAIIGGGLAGGVAALALSASGFSTALIDAESPETLTNAAYDGRTTALAYASGRLFQRLGLWPALEDVASPINQILVTDGALHSPSCDGGTMDAHLRFDARDPENGLDGEMPLGWIVENQRIRRAVADGLAEVPDTHVLAPARRLKTVNEQGASITTLADGRRVSAALTIAADGKRSRLAAEAGIKDLTWGYPQDAIIATVRHERPHRGIAQEYFLPAGPFAILPMTDNRSSIVWTETRGAARRYLALDDAAFLSALKTRFGDYLGALSLAGPRGAYPLSFRFAQRFYGERLALIGDAAHAIHPIAGQGYNLGVKDIAALVDVLVKARGLGQDIGAADVLAQYDRWRRFDAAGLAFGTDVLNRLFSNNIPFLQAARRIGLAAVNRIGPLKTVFMRESGADLGDLPTLLQPI